MQLFLIGCATAWWQKQRYTIAISRTKAKTSRDQFKEITRDLSTFDTLNATGSKLLFPSVNARMRKLEHCYIGVSGNNLHC